MSLTSEQITAKNFKEFYNLIKPYLNGNFPTPIVNQFDKANLYSTDEKIVGQWIDGKPLYQKTFTVQLSGTDASMLISIPNIDNLCDFEGYYNRGDQNNAIIAVNANSWTIQSALIVGKTSNGVEISYKGSIGLPSNSDVVVTCRYTKITDSTISIGTDTDYSTTEKIVGSWIDGKPLYQRTLVSNIQINDGNSDMLFRDQLINIDYIQKACPVMFKTNNSDLESEYSASQADNILTICSKVPSSNVGRLYVSPRLRTIYKTIATFQYTKTTD